MRGNLKLTGDLAYPKLSSLGRRKYKLEDLVEVHNMENPISTEPVPTMRQVLEYGILTGMLEELKAELPSENAFEKMKKRWNSILEKEKHKKE